MVSERGAAVALGVAGGSLATLLLSRAREARAMVPEGVDPQTWNMLASLLEAVAVQSQEIEQLTSAVRTLAAVGGMPVSEDGEDPFENYPKFVTGQVQCTVALQAENLPPIPIPKNKQLIIKAMPGNGGWIYLAFTQGQAQSLIVSYVLLPNEAVGLFIRNANQVWVMAPIVNDVVTYIVESD